VVVDTTVEDGSCVLSNARADQSLSTWVFLDKVANIVNDTSDSNEGLTILGTANILVPVNDWQLLQRNTPVKCLSLLVKLLLQLLETTLLDLVLLELLKIVCQAKLLPGPDSPFCRVILMPFDSVAVIRRELVVEVVVTFSEGNECSNDVITWGIAVIEGLITEPMCQGVNTESSLLNNEDAENSSIDESTPPISPSNTGDKAWENHTHENNTLDVVAVLPDNDGIVIKIRDIGTANSLWVLLHNHPSEMGVKKTFANRVWVLVGIGITVVSTMVSRPPADGSLNGTCTYGSEEDL